MARISESFSGKWLTAADLPKGGMRTTIAEVTEEEIGQGEDKKTKLVLWLKDTEKGLVLNKTNGNILAELLGDETDDWERKRIVLKSQKVEFQGKRVDGIRVDEEATKAANAAKAKSTVPFSQEEADAIEDDPRDRF